jgi:hypothetical protein
MFSHKMWVAMISKRKPLLVNWELENFSGLNILAEFWQQSFDYSAKLIENHLTTPSYIFRGLQCAVGHERAKRELRLHS